jgi:solute carrier family 10 (sodium/bile acid cotransporter), member 7
LLRLLIAGSEVASWKLKSFRIVQTINVMTVFLVSGVTLKAAEAKKALSKQGTGAFLYAVFIILGLNPLMGFAAVKIPFSVPEFSYGLAVFCSVPTTIAVGVALVTQAGGNSALALLITVATNLLGVVLSPFWLKAYLSSEASDVSVDALELLINLIITGTYNITHALREHVLFMIKILWVHTLARAARDTM